MIARLASLQARVPVLQLGALVIALIYGFATIDGLSEKSSIYAMLVLAALLGFAALGQTVVVLIGNLDLSIGAMISAGAIVLVQLVGVKHWAFGSALLVVVVLGVGVGALNGWICHRFELQSLIVTLATGAIVAGGQLVWTKGNVTGTAPPWLSRLTSPVSTTFGIGFPPLVALWIAVAIAVGVVLRRTRAGRSVYHAGSNPRAADLALVRTRWVWVGAFAVSGLMAALTGVLLAGFAGSANQNVGDPYLFQSLVAVFVGGTAIIGARGDYWRTLIGALLLTVLTTVLVGKGYSTADQQIVFGVLVLVVVAIYGRDARLRDRI
jgi:ribose transport system permease protein